MSKALLGEDGYLFLINDYNGVQSQTSGEYVLETSKLEAILAAHQAARARAESRGGAYLHIVAPNKETAYRQFLPNGFGYEVYGPTPLKQYFAAIPEASRFSFLDADLLLPKSGMISYERGESHWTPQGALSYMKHALSHFGRDADCARLDAIQAELREFDRQGDLALHAGLPAEQVIHLTPIDHPQICHFEGDIVNEGYYRHYSCSTGAGRALILHDSFGQALFPYISQIYAETLFFHYPNFALDLEERFSPDVVIKIQAERFFPYEPQTDESLLPWLQQIEESKHTSGATTNFFKTLLGFEPEIPIS